MHRYFADERDKRVNTREEIPQLPSNESTLSSFSSLLLFLYPSVMLQKSKHICSLQHLSEQLSHNNQVLVLAFSLLCHFTSGKAVQSTTGKDMAALPTGLSDLSRCQVWAAGDISHLWVLPGQWFLQASSRAACMTAARGGC